MVRPDAARYARDAADALGVRFEELDPEGYLFRLSHRGRSVLSGAGAVSPYFVNSATAVSIARDKAHAKSVLRAAGLPVIPGGLFFAHDRRRALRGSGREVADAVTFANRLGFPVFCKPNTGARGNLAEIVASELALLDYAGRVAREFEAFLVEPVVAGAEHRVVAQDGCAVFHVEKAAQALIGDGAATIGELLSAANARLRGTGVSNYPAATLAASGVDLGRRPATGERIDLPGRRNLSAHGDLASFSTDPPGPLADLALAALTALNLRIGGVDIIDASPARDLSALVVLEVNGSPGLKSLELAGRYDLVLGIWSAMIREALGL
jgi:D-alanine-D-alanine ligase-like ATP-grasp enzyme